MNGVKQIRSNQTQVLQSGANGTKFPQIKENNKVNVKNANAAKPSNLGGQNKTVQGPRVHLPSISDNKKQPSNKRDKLSKQKSLPNIRTLEKSMDQDTLKQLHKLINTSVSGNRISGPNSTPTSPNFEVKLCKAFDRAFGERDYQKQAVILQQLGDVYQQRAKEARIIDDIIMVDGTDDVMRAVSAYGGALVRTLHSEQRQSLLERLKETESLYIDMFHAGNKTKNVDLHDAATAANANQGIPFEKYSRRIEKFREFVRKRLNRIQDMWKHKFVVDERMPSRGQEFEVMKESLNLGNKVKNELKDVFKDIVADCVEKLGVPPCKYAIVGVGDIALNFATPYSDFQYIVLTARDVIEINEYFKYLANLINIEILLLCETPLTATNLTLIHDSNDKNLKTIFDDFTTNGLKVDVSAYANSINPFVFKYSNHIEESDQDVDLIKTPAQMVRFMYMLHDKGYHLFALTMYQNALICGDQDLYAEFRNMVDECFIPQPDAVLDERTLAARDCIVKIACKQYELCYYFETLSTSSNIALQHIIRDLKEFSTLLFAIKLVYGLTAKLPIQIIEELKIKGFITEEGESNLKTLICVVYFLLIRCHQLVGSQNIGKGVLKPDPHPENLDEAPRPINILKRIFNIDNAGMLIRTYASLLPLAQALKAYDQQNNLMPNLKVDLRPHSPEIFYQVYYRIMDYNKVCEVAKSVIGSNLPTSSPIELFKLYTNMGLIALKNGQVKVAGSMFTRAMETKELIGDDSSEKSIAFLVTWHNFGLAHMHDGRFEKAMTYFKESLQMYKDIVLDAKKLDATELPGGDEVCAMVENSIANVAIVQGRFQEAVVHLKQAHTYLNSVDMSSNFYMYSWNRAVLIQMANLYLYIGHFKLAKNIITRVTEFDMEISCVVSPNMNFIEDISMMAKLMNCNGKYDAAQLFATYTYQMMVLFLGENNVVLKPLDLEKVAMKDALVFLRSCREVTALSEDGNQCIDFASLITEMYVKAREVNRIEATEDKVNCIYHAIDLLELSKCLSKRNEHQKALEVASSSHSKLQVAFHKTQPNLLMSETIICMGLSHLKMGHLDDALKHFQLAKSGFNVTSSSRLVPIQMNLLEHIAETYKQKKLYEEAIKTWEDCISHRRHLYGSVHANVAHSYRMQGLLLQEIMDFDNAVSSFQTSLEMYKVLYGKDNSEVAQVHFNLGTVYDDMFENEKAEHHLLRALETRRYLFKGSDKHPENVELLTYIGGFYKRQNNVDRAIIFHKNAIENCELVHGKVSLKTSKIYAQLAEDLHSAERNEECVEAYETAVNLYEQAMGDEHHNLEVANWLRELGRTYEALGIRDKATQCHRRSIEIKEQHMGKEAADADLLESLSRLAVRYEGKGDYKRAIPLRRQYLKKHTQMMDGTPSAETANALIYLSNDYLQVREFEYALAYNEQLLNMLKEMYGTDKSHEEIARAVLRRGNIFDRMGRLHKAIRLFKEAIVLYKALNKDTRGTYNEAIADCMMHLGNSMTKAGQQESEVVLTEAINMVLAMKLNENRKRLLARTYYFLGEAFEVYPKFEKAIVNHEKALKIRREINESPHVEIADSLRAVGNSRCKLKQFNTGLPHLLQALQVCKQLDVEGGSHKKQYAHSLLEIGQAYADADNPIKGVEYMQQALTIMIEIYGDKNALHIARCLEHLAEASSKANKPEDSLIYAIKSLQKYHGILKYIEDHPVFAHLNDLMGDAHMKMNNTERAVQFYKKAAQMYLSLHNGRVVTWDVERAMKKYKDAERLHREELKSSCSETEDDVIE